MQGRKRTNDTVILSGRPKGATSRLIVLTSLVGLLGASTASSQPLTEAQLPECPAGLSATAASDAAPLTEVPPVPCGELGASPYVFRRNPDGKVLPILVEGPRGPQVRVAVSYQQLKALQVADGPLPPAWQMSREALAQLVDQLDTVRASTEKYQDVNVAMAEGYGGRLTEGHRVVVHFQHPGRMTDGRFNPAEPEMLLYTQRDGHWHLIGTAFILPREQMGDDHPDGFVGPLDNWHVHYNVCLEGRTRWWLEPQACEQRGGRSGHGFGWMVHAWVWEENAKGVFSYASPFYDAGSAARVDSHDLH